MDISQSVSISTTTNNGLYYNDIIRNKRIYILNHLDNDDFLQEFIEQFSRESKTFNFAGFDCEWAQGENISLIQIAFPDGFCFLIRILYTKFSLPLQLINWMKDETKLKFGISIVEDGEMLINQWNIILRGCVDLRHLAVQLPNNGLLKMGLKSFGQNWLSFQSLPNKFTQCSNWSKMNLDSQQIEYACLDGFIGALSPIEFLCRKFDIKPFDALTQLDKIFEFSQPWCDLKFKNQCKTNHDQSEKIILPDVIVLNNRNMEINRISRKKADIQIRKKLAEKISDEPFVIKLFLSKHFTMKWIPVLQCVVCGCKNIHGRFDIVPLEFWRYYPSYLKKLSSNFKMPLCSNCYNLSKTSYINKQNTLSINYDHFALYENVTNETHERNMNDRKPEFQTLVIRNDVPTIEGNIVNFCKQTCDSVELKLVKTLTSVESLNNFESMWKDYFMEKMQPQFLYII